MHHLYSLAATLATGYALNKLAGMKPLTAFAAGSIAGALVETVYFARKES